MCTAHNQRQLDRRAESGAVIETTTMSGDIPSHNSTLQIVFNINRLAAVILLCNALSGYLQHVLIKQRECAECHFLNSYPKRIHAPLISFVMDNERLI